MTGTTGTTERGESPPIAAVAPVVFGVVLSLTAFAYFVTVNAIDWVTVTVLAYPVQAVAPFVVISGAILTIPIIIPTVLVTMKATAK
ncbi:MULTISPECIES: hypothetical protein [Haloferacaceae]|uniref:Cox cluster protein n=1 Tax=Halorubrum glutamatedens TaxID=2707018 RepID=A0ABD5QNZ4_9EURY|nr:hypothetical protein [Halobellus captivus]